MSKLLNLLLSRWEADPPIISAPEMKRWEMDGLEILQMKRLVRETTPAGSVDCPDCSRRCRIEFISDPDGIPRGYLHCPDCGLSEVTGDMQQRWDIDTPSMLKAIFDGANSSINRRSPPFLWEVGKANWAGRSRQIWFARAFRRGHCNAAVEILHRNPSSIVFTPTDNGAAHWREAAGNLVIPLDGVVSLNGGGFQLDLDDVEGRIIDAGMGTQLRAKKPPAKRAGRLSDIERLRSAVIEHLVSARDHAFTTKKQQGEAQLLPRPSQKDLGKIVGLDESKVSRCLSDPNANELRLYWEVATDLDQIMKFTGPINKGPRT